MSQQQALIQRQDDSFGISFKNARKEMIELWYLQPIPWKKQMYSVIESVLLVMVFSGALVHRIVLEIFMEVAIISSSTV